MSQISSYNSSILAAINQLSLINQSISQTTLSLSTGLAINSASDDPAGLVSVNQLQAALAYLEGESSALQATGAAAATVDDALGEAATLLTEANGIAVQLAGGGLSSEEEDALKMQLDDILEQVDDLGVSTEYGDTALLNGSGTLSAFNESIDLIALDSDSLGETDIGGTNYTLSDIATGGALADDPESMQAVIAAALSEVTAAQVEVGSFQSYTVEANLNVTTSAIESLTSATSSILDTDYAAATAQLAQQTLLGTTSLLALSILLDNSQSVLDLLSSD